MQDIPMGLRTRNDSRQRIRHLDSSLIDNKSIAKPIVSSSEFKNVLLPEHLSESCGTPSYSDPPKLSAIYAFPTRFPQSRCINIFRQISDPGKQTTTTTTTNFPHRLRLPIASPFVSQTQNSLPALKVYEYRK